MIALFYILCVFILGYVNPMMISLILMQICNKRKLLEIDPDRYILSFCPIINWICLIVYVYILTDYGFDESI